MKFTLLLGAGCALGLLVATPTAQAFEFTTHGYYRMRFEALQDLDTQKPNDAINQGDTGDNDRFGTIAFGQQRFRLDPILKLNDNISFQGQLDILDNLLFGQSEIQSVGILNPVVGTVQPAGANGAFGVTGGNAGDPLVGGGGNIVVKRLWTDVFTPIGKFRLGRQPIHWGLGIVQNSGNEQNDDFGDTADAVTYLTAYQFKNGGTLNSGLTYTFSFENTVDPTTDGLEGEIGNNNADTHQAILFGVYQSDTYEIGSFGGLRWRRAEDFAATTTAIYLQDTDGDNVTEAVSAPAGLDGDTALFVIDLYGKGSWGPYTLGLEAVYIGGTVTTGIAIDAIPFTEEEQATYTNPISSPIEMQPESDISVFMAALEFEGNYDFGEFKLQAGYAPGDADPLSTKITQFGFRKDYDIAMLLFQEPLGTSPPVQVADGRTVLGHNPVSGTSLNNAAYAALGYKHHFDISSTIPQAKDFKVGLKGITAWAPANNLDIDFTEITGVDDLPHYLNTSRWYGFEVDASAEATFFDHLNWLVQFGLFLPGGLYDVKTDDIDNFNTGGIVGIDFDAADPVFAAKTALFFEF